MELNIESLKESTDFLNDLYANVTSAIFLTDGTARIHHFNDAFRTLFYKPEDQVIGELCGNVIGCIFTVEEGRPCGETSACDDCPLRRDIVTSFTQKVPVYKDSLSRDFVLCDRRVTKHFQFTTKYATYRGMEYVLVIVDDVTELKASLQALEARNEELSRRNADLEALLQRETHHLVAATRKVDGLNRDKNELLQEVRHRVGNNLQVITSLLNLASPGRQGDDSGFQALRCRISAVVEVYRHADYDGQGAQVRAQGLVAAIFDIVARPLGFRVEPKDLVIELPLLSMDAAVIFGIALGEILQASCAQALRLGGGGRIRIRLGREGDQGLLLVDDGLPRKGHATEAEDISLARILAEQVGGCLRPAGPGVAQTSFAFPLGA